MFFFFVHLVHLVKGALFNNSYGPKHHLAGTEGGHRASREIQSASLTFWSQNSSAANSLTWDEGCPKIPA
jgi:hypothetical protein